MNDDLFQQGLEIRRAVLGPEYVDKSIASADDFNRPMQELVTEYCWGAIWGRPGLERRTRSMLNLAMLSALGKPARAEAPRQGRHPQRRLQGGDHRGVPAGGDLLRRAGRDRLVPRGAGDLQGDGE
jgi:4-carboxymuconolactone decarboxylase